MVRRFGMVRHASGTVPGSTGETCAANFKPITLSMGISLSVDEFVRDPARHIERVARQGERLTLSRNGVPVAEVTPPQHGGRTLQVDHLREVMATLPHLPQMEADAFARDLEAARRSAPANSLRDPWAS